MMTANELYVLIEAIEKRKRAEGIIPTYALRIAEIQPALAGRATASEIDAMLCDLRDAGRIRAGSTVNDTYVKTL